MHLFHYGWKPSPQQYFSLIDYHHHHYTLTPHISCYMENILIIRHFGCLALNAFHIHGIQETINFVGHSEKYKGYKCFHPPSHKFFISRHVVFDETVFPFKSSSNSPAASHVLNILDSWIPFSNTFLETDVETEVLPQQSVSTNLIPLPTVDHHSWQSASHSTHETTALENDVTNFNTQLSAARPMHTPMPVLNTKIQPALFPQINDPQIAEPHPPHSPHEATTRHAMLTRSQHGVVKSNPKYALTITSSPTIPREPNNIKAALMHPGWKDAMDDELTTLHHNDTWRLVPHTLDMHVIGSKWVFKTKLKPDGTLDRLKARLVAKGYHQIDGIDYIETFSPVIKPGSSAELVDSFIHILSCEFSMKDLGHVHHFLGVEISTTTDGLYLSQSHYAPTILDRSSMLHCKPMSTLLEVQFKIDVDTSSITDPSQFRRIVGALQYLTLT